MQEKDKTTIQVSEQSSMVDVGLKAITRRTAMAECYIHFPAEVYATLSANEFLTHKGSVISTSTVAGLMGVKKTPDILPLCHPIAVSGTKLNIIPEDNKIRIQCEVKCEGKTGVEMEALTGASVAALCIYDMCKAFSQQMTITDLKLSFKKGGKSDYEG